MTNREPFALNEWYHCYNRGVDKRVVFESKTDYERFLKVLYLANSTDTFHIAMMTEESLADVLKIPRTEQVVAIGAYCLMPNHFHLLLKETTEGGITAFMRKVGSAYTMYFNTRRERTGNLFLKPFRSRHIADDTYFQHCVRYIHCNPGELFESGWKTGSLRTPKEIASRLLKYPYSSLGAHNDMRHPLRVLLNEEIFDVVENVPARTMIKEAIEYYALSGNLSKLTR